MSVFLGIAFVFFVLCLRTRFELLIMTNNNILLNSLEIFQPRIRTRTIRNKELELKIMSFLVSSNSIEISSN